MVIFLVWSQVLRVTFSASTLFLGLLLVRNLLQLSVVFLLEKVQ